MSGCQCNDPRVWAYGPCDYCSEGEWCGDCEHEVNEGCPDDCYCNCNDHVRPEGEEEEE